MKFKRSRRAVVRRKIHRRLIVRIAPVCTISIILLALYFVLFTDAFTVRDVQFLGSSNLPMDSLRAVTAGVVGDNLITVSLSKIRERLLSFPEISDVTFRRRLFHRLDCYFRAREPVALIADGGISEIDDEGVIVTRSEEDGGVDLPIITGVTRDETVTPEGKAKVENALEVLRLLKMFGFSPAEQLSEIHLEKDEVMLVWMDTGTLIRVGRDEFHDKVRKLRAVYGVIDGQGGFPELIDLRFDRQVIVR
jgi:cell division protein FtsQ